MSDGPRRALPGTRPDLPVPDLLSETWLVLLWHEVKAMLARGSR